MIIKDNRLSCKENWYIKQLDLIRINCDEHEDTYIVMGGIIGDQIRMFSLNDGEEYDHDIFNHPIHLHNHLLKHYGSYELIKSKDLEINLIGPVREIKKGVRL